MPLPHPVIRAVATFYIKNVLGLDKLEWLHYGSKIKPRFAMATITLKDIPDELHEALKKRASLNRRTRNTEILTCLEATVQSGPIDVDSYLHRIRLLRKKVSGRLSNRELKALKEEGRP